MKNTSDYLWENLFRLPYFRGLLRAVESTFYDGLPIENPCLDLGCGDGIFAQITFDQKIDVGIDPWFGPLQAAKRTDSYSYHINGMGNQLPFQKEYFQTVISNSVLEHITDLDPVLIEVNRVLKADGYFYFCVPNEKFLNTLSISTFFDKIGLKIIGNSYRRFFNKISRHYHCDDQNTWRQRLEQSNFKLLKAWDYFTPEAFHVLEWGHYFGLPSWIVHLFFKKWVLIPDRWNLSITRKITERHFLSNQVSDKGCYSFYIAQKIA